jgi:endonuclease/exonuclease/phosphatase family metal-dependent hydrolase
MKTEFYAALTAAFYLQLFCIMTSPPTWAEESSKTSLRILCYNIRHGRGMDNVVELERTANVIKEWKPDLVALQEVDRNTQRTNKTDQAKILAEHLKMHHVYGKAIDFQGGEYGLAILSRFPISGHEMILLPPDVQQEQRGVLIAKISIPDADTSKKERIIRFASTHLSVASQAERQVQTEKIDVLLSEGDEPAIVAGDFNARPTSEPIVRFLKNWKDAADPTLKQNVTSVEPGRIDFIFFRAKDSFEVLESRTIDDKFTSDHMPIFSVLSF